MATPVDSEAFWSKLEALVRGAELVIDRPKGTRHPRYPHVVYGLDYGYLRGTSAGDGDGIDVWVGSAGSHEITGIVCTVDAMKRDAEIKVLLGCTEGDVEAIVAFHSEGAMAAFAVMRAQ